MPLTFRERAVLSAACKYADACSRFRVYRRGAPDLPTEAWSPEFRKGYERLYGECGRLEKVLLRLSQRL